MKFSKCYDIDICVCCGNPVPEGVMVCNVCKQSIINSSKVKTIKPNCNHKNK